MPISKFTKEGKRKRPEEIAKEELAKKETTINNQKFQLTPEEEKVIAGGRGIVTPNVKAVEEARKTGQIKREETENIKRENIQGQVLEEEAQRLGIPKVEVPTSQEIEANIQPSVEAFTPEELTKSSPAIERMKRLGLIKETKIEFNKAGVQAAQAYDTITRLVSPIFSG
jgi:hypothetical protein